MQINPVIEKDLKVKMRGWRAPALIAGYLGFLFLVIFLFFFMNNQMDRYNMSVFNPKVSLNAYNTLALFQLCLILFITPAMTGGAISGEKERQTFDLLLCTSFSSFKIIIGKVFVSIAHIILLITASLPIMAIVFMFGGVSILDILLLFVFYIVCALFVGTLGIFYSSIFKKSIVAIIVTYITLLFFTVGTPIILTIVYYLLNINGPMSIGYEEVSGFLFSNPFYGFGSVIYGTADRYSTFSAFVQLSYGNIDGNTKVLVQPWIINMTFNIIATVILVVLSSLRIRRLK